MKRVFQHIAFWSCYILLCMLIEYLWAKAQLPDLSQAEYIKGMLIVATVTSMPEILFAYYMMYVGFDRFLKRKVPVWRSLLEIFIVLIISMALVRSVTNFVYGSLVYGGRMAEKDILDPRILPRVIIFMGFSSGLALAIKFLRDQLKAKEREKNLVREKLSTELKFLRNQLHPHFLFNTLNNIYSLTRKKSDQAPEAVMKLSELLSFILYESGKETIPIEQELHFLEDYISLEKIRYSDRLKISVQKEISDTNAQIAPLILLPLVENAFKHGISETRFDSYIRIHVFQSGDQFRFTIENSTESEKTSSSPGKIGLVNIQRQLELMYREQAIRIEHTNNLFTVNLSLNLLSYGKI